jgi:hypothetical protein
VVRIPEDDKKDKGDLILECRNLIVSWFLFSARFIKCATIAWLVKNRIFFLGSTHLDCRYLQQTWHHSIWIRNVVITYKLQMISQIVLWSNWNYWNV